MTADATLGKTYRRVYVHTGGICLNPGCAELPGRDERINLLAVRSHAGEEEACVLNIMLLDRNHAESGFGMKTCCIIGFFLKLL